MNFNLLLLENAKTFESMPAPFGFDTWLTFWLVMAISVTNAILMAFAGYKFLHVLQLSSYKMKGYFKWIKDNKGNEWGRLIVLSFLSSAALLITNVLLEDFFVYKIMTYLGLVFYLIFCIVYIVNQYSASQKVPLKYTKRMTRLVVVYAIIVFLLTVLILNLSILYVPYFKHGAVGLIPMLVPLLVCIAYYITLPFENAHNKKFVKKATKKLDDSKNLIKIGITGSYAKTSVKNILTTLLSVKYRVLGTPQSFNTPLGISKAVLENSLDGYDIFIAEMGARYVGDIKELCDIVKPNIGIITGLGNQHLLTFENEENLISTKGELSDFVSQTNGKMFFNGDCEKNKILFDKCTSEKVISFGFDETQNLFAKNLKYDNFGVSFDIVFNGKTFNTHAGLLGKHNVSNIMLCVSVCLSLGLTIEEVLKGIELLIPSPHRMALVPSNGALVIIDDAYNGSVEGSKAALDVLSNFDGTKVVITPGLVELGKDQISSNKQFGKMIAQTADFVIINGTTNYESLLAGLKEANMPEEKILRAGSLSQATQLLAHITKPGDVVLFENDLPDNYN